MIQKIVTQWEVNKHKLEAYFRATRQEDISYEQIVKNIFELCVSGFDVSKMTVIDNGDYQGALIFIIPKDIYQPEASDYIITNARYGSCSTCDTLIGISNYEDGLPTEDQIKQYMTLALHLVQKCKWLWEDDE